MKTTTTHHAFIEAFRIRDRVSHFDIDGLHALYQYLTDLEDDTGDQMELDVIALCCEFTRFEDIADYNEQYGTNYGDASDVDGLACMIGDNAFITYAH